MKAVLRARRLLSLCVLPIALWSASPSIRWCTISWADFPECMVRAPDGRCDLVEPARAAGAEADAGCGLWAWGLLCDGTRCPPGGADAVSRVEACAAECGALACDPAARDDIGRAAAIPPESPEPARGFCVRGPVGGVGVRTELVEGWPPQPLHALAVSTLEARVETPRPAHIRTDERARAPTAPRAIRPPVRAPPCA